MHCWNCGTRNPDENSFCGRCGRRIASTANSTAQDAAPVAAADVRPPQTNPLVEEPRAIHESPRVISQMETTRSATIAPPTPPIHEPPRRESLPPLQMSRPENTTRITGPSFLGLSDESTGTGSSDYLLYDDEPERSSWRGWLALAVLVLLGFLVYKQWNQVSEGAQILAQQAKDQLQQTSGSQKPASNVSGADQSSSAPQNQPPNATTPQPPADTSNEKKDEVNKPESDHTTGSPAESKEEAAAATKDETAAPTKEKSAAAKKDDGETVAEDTVTPSKEAKKQTADDEDSREATPSKATTKATTPAEPKFNDSQVEEAQRYLTGQGVRQDCGRAISLLRSSAREGNPRAQVKLGALYATGQCVTQDRAAAYEWLARAQETQPHNNYLQRTMSSLWANMTPEERTRITK
jgi:TPR repeat protein